MLGIPRFRIYIQDILHPPHKLGIDSRNTPLLRQPGLDIVFFSTRRTVSSEMLSTSPGFTRRSASNCILQCLRPVGGVLLDSAINSATPCVSNLSVPPGRRRSLRAYARLPSTNFRRVRCAVEAPQWTASAISPSVLPSWASNKICARFSFRALVVPLLVNASKVSFSSASSSLSE